MTTDKDWEKWGKKDPYYGVLTDNKFRTKNLNPDIKKEFFETGRNDISHVTEVIKLFFNPKFSPQKALDYGCGTGRLVIPLSQIAKNVIGVDVSESMLKEARANCIEQSISNVKFIKADDCLSNLNESFDFIHSSIVFQHIPIKRGIRIFQKLLDLLEEDGFGAIQITYAHSKYSKSFGKPSFKLCKQILKNLKSAVNKILFRQEEPAMEMNKYDLDELLYIMQKAGVRNFFSEYTDHGGELGLYLYFCKSKKKIDLKRG